MRAPENWTRPCFTALWWDRVRQHFPFYTGSQRELKGVLRAHVGSLWKSKRSHDFQTSRKSPFWHRPFFPSFLTKAWLWPMALHWPTLHPDLSPGVVRAPRFWCELLSAGSWEQLRAHQMPGWWVPSKRTDWQFLWFCFFVYACKTSPDSSSATSALRNIWNPDGQEEPLEDSSCGMCGYNTELWSRSSQIEELCLHLCGLSWVNLNGLDRQLLCFLWLPSKSTRYEFRFSLRLWATVIMTITSYHQAQEEIQTVCR